MPSLCVGSSGSGADAEAFVDVIDGGGAKGVDLVGGPEVRRELFGEYAAGEFDPVRSFQFARRASVRANADMVWRNVREARPLR